MKNIGFKNINRVEYIGINIDVLNDLAVSKNIESFDVEILRQNGLISSKDKVKILGRGELTAKINVVAHAISASARKAIEELDFKTILNNYKNNDYHRFYICEIEKVLIRDNKL